MAQWRALVAKARVLGLIPGGTYFFPALPYFKGLKTVAITPIVLFKMLLKGLQICPSIGPGCDYAWNSFLQQLILCSKHPVV